MTIKNNPPPPELASIGCCHLNKKKLDCYLAQTHSFHLFQVSKLFSFTWTMGALACKLLYYLQVGEKERNAHSEFPNPVLCRFYIYALTGRVRSVLRPQPHSAQLRKARRKGTKQRMMQFFISHSARSYTGEFTLAAKSFTFATLLFPLFCPRENLEAETDGRRESEGRFPFMFFSSFVAAGSLDGFNKNASKIFSDFMAAFFKKRPILKMITYCSFYSTPSSPNTKAQFQDSS